MSGTDGRSESGRVTAAGATIALTLALASTPATAAFDGPRVYWPLPKNTNIVTGLRIGGTANASWSNWNAIQPNVDISSETYLLNYIRVQPVLGRTIYWQALLPAATLDTSSALPVDGADSFVNGIGDPALGATVNLYGAPEMMAKHWLRHDLDLSVNLGLLATLPLGEYDGDETLNVGSNQWKTRLSLPIVKSLNEWVPGRRTTLELMPAVVLFGDNDEAGDNRIEQDPLYSVELHLTRDLTEESFISLDYTLLDGGEETFVDRASGTTVRDGDGLDASLVGATLGWTVNDNMQLFVTHMQTLSESSDDDVSLEGSLTKVTISWSWHDVLERVRRF